jgi:imidazolonepropionase-like amidohydrolase
MFKATFALGLPVLMMLAACTSARPHHSGPITGNGFAVDHVRAFDGSKSIEDTTVVVRDGLIEAVGKDLRVPEDLPLIDGSGKTLLPGLIDAHTHTYYEGALIDALRFGVTTELDMLTNVDFAAQYAPRRTSMAQTNLADLWSAVRLVTSERNDWLKNPTLTSPVGAEEFVRARIAEGSDYIKIHYEPNRPEIDKTAISRETLEATVAAAHKQGKIAVVHVTQIEPARHAVEAGADGLAHVFLDEVVDDALLAKMKRRRTFVVPTLVVFLAGSTDEEPWKELTADTRLAPFLSKNNLGSLTFLETNKLPHRSVIDPAKARATVKRLQANGIDVLAGTDTPNPGIAHGVSMHGELSELVKAGLTPAQALAAATRLPAERFGLKDRGRIAAGQRADLVMVEGDPTMDITASRAIVRIFKNGFEIDRAVPPPPPPKPAAP